MRADLERLGRYDEHRVRQRLRDSFSTRYTSVIVVEREPAGCVTVLPADGGQLLEHFYLAPHHQGRGSDRPCCARCWGTPTRGP